jgi:dephospho-CoA kinase
MNRPVRYLGLTGGIATGKSTAAEMFRESGAEVIDADQVAREVVAPGSAGLAEIRAVFGDAVLTEEGALDREALGRLVFPDPVARARLEAIVHPLVAATVAERRRRLHSTHPERLVVYDVPLLFETGMEGEFDRVVVVYVPRAEQVRRLLARDGISALEAEHRLSAQMDIEEKAKRADEVLDNTGTRDELRLRVADLLVRLGSARRAGRSIRG